jgi:hypothetical protein
MQEPDIENECVTQSATERRAHHPLVQIPSFENRCDFITENFASLIDSVAPYLPCGRTLRCAPCPAWIPAVPAPSSREPGRPAIRRESASRQPTTKFEWWSNQAVSKPA